MATDGDITIRLRDYRPEDAETLAGVYRDAVRTLGPAGYGDEQVRVWARYPDDLEGFRRDLGRGLTVCSVVDDVPVAFGRLDPVDHVALLYCGPAYAGRGHATAIVGRLEERARASGVGTLRVEASVVARSFFERHGFRLVGVEHPVRDGVEFTRFRMEKRLRG